MPHGAVNQKNYEKYVLIEIPKGSNVKYEIKNDKLICDRILHTPVNYIFNYGCFKHTLANDGDPLDVVVITDSVFFPGCYVLCKIIGVLITDDEKGRDEKIITVPANSIDPDYSNYNDISDLPISSLNKIKFFFENYKKLEKDKNVRVGEFFSKKIALNFYNQYKEKYMELHPEYIENDF